MGLTSNESRQVFKCVVFEVCVYPDIFCVQITQYITFAFADTASDGLIVSKLWIWEFRIGVADLSRHSFTCVSSPAFSFDRPQTGQNANSESVAVTVLLEFADILLRLILLSGNLLFLASFGVPREALLLFVLIRLWTAGMSRLAGFIIWVLFISISERIEKDMSCCRELNLVI